MVLDTLVVALHLLYYSVQTTLLRGTSYDYDLRDLDAEVGCFVFHHLCIHGKGWREGGRAKREQREIVNVCLCTKHILL